MYMYMYIVYEYMYSRTMYMYMYIIKSTFCFVVIHVLWNALYQTFRSHFVLKRNWNGLFSHVVYTV